MTIEAATEFRAMINETPALQSAIRDLMGDDGLLDLTGTKKLGQQHGYEFDEDEIESLIANDNDALSDFELEMVSAGIPINCNSASQGINT